MKPAKYRHHLLCTAGAALALLLAAAPAQAQTAPQATGTTVLLNDQANSGSNLSDASGAALNFAAGPLTGSTTEVSGNTLETSSSANRASLILAPDSLVPSSIFVAPLVTIGGSDVTASAETVAVNRQTMTGGAVDADILDAPLSISAGEVRSSSIALTDNQSDSQARGNDAVAQIESNNPGTAGSAAIAGLQSMDAGSDVAARSWSGTDLHARQVEGSTLDNSGNLVRAVAQGNRSDSQLAANTQNIDENPGTDPAATVSANGGAQSNALFAILGNQSASGSIRAVAGNRLDSQPFQTVIDRKVDGSAVTSDGNVLGSAAYANSSTNTLALSANAVITAPSTPATPNFAVANITSVQTNNARIGALTLGGTGIDIVGTVTASSISASDGSDQTSATANLSENSLSVDGASDSSTSFAGHSQVARVDSAGNAEFYPALGTQNWQANHGSLTASHVGSSAVTIGGATSGASLSVDDNDRRATATGNGATNSSDVTASRLGLAVGVSNYQTGDGDVSSQIGSATSRADYAVTGTSIENSDLSVSGNSASGAAIANNATNNVTASAAAIGPGDNPWANQTAYTNDLGAEATLTLANTQRIGRAAAEPGPLQAISSDVRGGASISGTTFDQASLTLDDNSQRAEALGNIAANRIGATTTSFSGEAGAALLSSQAGNVAVSAKSDARFGLSGALTDTQASLAGNTNVAIAELNDASNTIDIDAVHATGTTLAAPDGSGHAVLADLALGNMQRAGGTVSANAISSFEGSDGSPLTDSRLTIAENVTSAAATANRASSLASITAVDASPGTGLGNVQANSAEVLATAQSSFGGTSGSLTDGSTIALSRNQVSAIAKANSVDNQIGAAAMPGASTALATIGALNDSPTAPAALVNRQTNAGAVMATAMVTGPGTPSGTSSLMASNLALNGNSAIASGYGNVASNAITAPAGSLLPGAAIANVQSNSGMVNAFASQAPLGSYGMLNGSSLTFSGNSISATAVGNQSASLIGKPR